MKAANSVFARLAVFLFELSGWRDNALTMAQQYAEIESLDWFHPNLTRHTAESILLQNGKDGTYLLRPSSKGCGEYALSVKFEQSVKHFNIVWTGDNLSFGHGTFKTIDDFVEHFKNKPLIGTESSQLVLLKVCS